MPGGGAVARRGHAAASAVAAGPSVWRAHHASLRADSDRVVSPPKTSLTESSAKMRRIESASNSAHGNTRHVVGNPRPRPIVSVTTISSRSGTKPGSRTRLPRRRRAWRRHRRGAPSLRDLCAAAFNVPAVSIMSSTITRCLAAHVTDHVADLGHLLGGSLLVEDRELGADLRCEALVSFNGRAIGGHDDEVGQTEVAEHRVSMNSRSCDRRASGRSPGSARRGGPRRTRARSPAASMMRATKRAGDRLPWS